MEAVFIFLLGTLFGYLCANGWDFPWEKFKEKFTIKRAPATAFRIVE
jgi:hypothetical protein